MIESYFISIFAGIHSDMKSQKICIEISSNYLSQLRKSVVR